MTGLKLKFILIFSSISAFCLGTGVADTCPATASTQCIPGLPGRDGKDGQPGIPGRDGRDGLPGRDGITSASVLQGPAGLNGTDGEPGPQGPVGPTGLQGPAGLNGTDGEPGLQGPAGAPGTGGIDGAPGRNGTDGLPGLPGTVSDAAVEQLRRNLLEDVKRLLFLGTSANNPAASCEEISESNPHAPTGYYWVNTNSGVEQVRCEHEAGRITNCYHAMILGATQSGVYRIQPINSDNSFNVYCDMETDGGGWTVLLKRQDGSVEFQHNWADYKSGFGNLEGEHWLGLDNMYLLTHQSGDPPQLRVDLADWEGNTAFAKFDQFSVGDEDSDYTLSVSGYQSDSTAGDSLAEQNGQRFSTPDRDNDVWPDHCAVYFHGPWWHSNCYHSLLTGKYYTSGGPHSLPRGVVWITWKGTYYSLRFAEMKIRPGGV